ncbi:hypothetical protein KAJ61_05500 [Candidatus Parcubacteria bacterium]|nr:hypothetical protein [Candidatus Parcubacteria bacterium]
MKSIIQELQSEATKHDSSVTELLRKSKIVASKLELNEFLAWIEKELNGYNTRDYKEIPIYRMIKGEPKGWNPYHGWITVMFSNTRSQETLSKMPINQPAGELEDLYNSGSDNLQVPYVTEAQKIIGEAVNFKIKFALMVGKSSLAGILDAVRNIILDWSIKLEKEGILGEGIIFSKEDKEKAQEPKTVIEIGRIDKFVGNVGSVNDNATVNISHVSQNEVDNIKKLVGQIKDNLNNIEIVNTNKKEVEKEIKCIEAEIVKEEPEKSKIFKCFSSIKSIIEGASGNVVAQGIIYGIEKLF